MAGPGRGLAGVVAVLLLCQLCGASSPLSWAPTLLPLSDNCFCQLAGQIDDCSCQVYGGPPSYRHACKIGM